MLWIPQKGDVLTEDNIATTGTTTPGTSVTTGGAATTKGTPAELIASTAFDAYWVTILASNYGSAAAAAQGAMDLLIGSATEEVLIPNMLFGHAGNYGSIITVGPKRWDFPLYIPAGQRLAVQACGQRTSTAFRVQIFLYGGNGYPPFRVGSKVTTYGIGTLPRGVTLTPGASGAAGSWTEITSGTTEDHFAFVPSFQVATDTTTNTRMLTAEIGIGSATEELISQPYMYVTDSGECMEGATNSFPTFHDVPSGTRLVMRASNSGTNDGSYDGVIHALS